MNQFAIFTDSSCDLPQAIVQEYALNVLPLRVRIGGAEYSVYPDAHELPTDVFYRHLRDGEEPFTAAVSVDTFLESMTPVLEDGQDVLYIGFSSALSETYQNACMACAQLREKYPDRQIIPLDTKSASMGEGLLVYRAAQLREAGGRILDAHALLVDLIPKLCHWFTLSDLKFLKRGGRISATTAAVGSALHIMPVLHMDDGGHLINYIKVRGRGASVRALFHRMESTAADIGNQTVMISYGECKADAQQLARHIHDTFHPARIIVNAIDPVIAAHTGPSTLALFFIGSQR